MAYRLHLANGLNLCAVKHSFGVITSKNWSFPTNFVLHIRATSTLNSDSNKLVHNSAKLHKYYEECEWHSVTVTSAIPPHPKVLVCLKKFFIVGNFLSKNKKMGLQIPKFGGNLGAKLKFLALIIISSVIKFVVICRNIATFCPSYFLTHNTAATLVKQHQIKFVRYLHSYHCLIWVQRAVFLYTGH